MSAKLKELGDTNSNLLLSNTRVTNVTRINPPKYNLFHNLVCLAMSSDADYAAFLDKANEQSGATSSSRDKARFSAKAVDTDVPEELKTVSAYYTSDSDEPFEPVSLK